MKKLILASQSPARREILQTTGYPFVVEVSDYEEDMTLKLEPNDLAIHLSKGKAKDVASRHKDAVILAADSFAVFGNELLGKPHTQERAKEMLAMLSGPCHSFVTGFTIIDGAITIWLKKTS
jgi:septum formation protein